MNDHQTSFSIQRRSIRVMDDNKPLESCNNNNIKKETCESTVDRDVCGSFFDFVSKPPRRLPGKILVQKAKTCLEEYLTNKKKSTIQDTFESLKGNPPNFFVSGCFEFLLEHPDDISSREMIADIFMELIFARDLSLNQLRYGLTNNMKRSPHSTNPQIWPIAIDILKSIVNKMNHTVKIIFFTSFAEDILPFLRQSEEEFKDFLTILLVPEGEKIPKQSVNKSADRSTEEEEEENWGDSTKPRGCHRGSNGFPGSDDQESCKSSNETNNIADHNETTKDSPKKVCYTPEFLRQFQNSPLARKKPCITVPGAPPVHDKCLQDRSESSKAYPGIFPDWLKHMLESCPKKSPKRFGNPCGNK
ncbi:uncharacterized protein LOC141849535 [Brevipalpus obovatus]|uniref:uncharacterized protein LOC141849535 n=1 Tax=Brevipalpus obovatus TaxID=246614 RepID=UPI003D9E9DDB